MIKTALEFAPGTTETNKKIILGMFQPGELLQKYRMARIEHGADVVLWTSTRDPSDFFAGTRQQYCEFLKRTYPKVAHAFGMWSKSAHTVMQLPKDSDAFWLVITIPGQEMPSMTVIYGVSYEQAAEGVELTQ